ncbi:Rhamnolipids biosynthesis 3-oxoacyl-[acyl-carrier-protein] reductase [Grifola frondosa]|uniref:Rhamnolipids biosynthesis 3-oxoacyl-[acyl-carrier-protein] reductase n=1 Tax=Grifola frondosa TaxID=5627 RepID=A0A1C7ML05_GRIFR|nr:Rhamnolipids biosynthesis 3-oxoacyl-[acyl-carrier-protein] reductase [Grifola frondosa]
MSTMEGKVLVDESNSTDNRCHAKQTSVPSLFNIKGKVAVVTGGGSGIGTMIASAFVQNGAKVYIASRKEKQLKEVSEALTKKGPGSCHYFVADLSTKAGCEGLAAAIKEKEQKVHILVNNSGATWGAKYNEVPEKEGWDKVMALNVKSIFYLTAALTDLLAKDSTNLDPGRVINISSVASFLTVASAMVADAGHGLWSYGTSKAAVNQLTNLLATTLAPRFITVNAILPGVFPSKMTAYGLKMHGDEGLSAGHPMGRNGIPRDLAGVALFLASPAAAYVSGTQIIVDGAGVISRTKASL